MVYSTPRFKHPSRESREMVEVRCAYCGGRGVDPFGLPGPESNCSVCGGKGYNRVMTPHVVCASCGGTGKQLGRRLTCSACKGRGVITVRKPTATCPQCHGTGIQPGDEFRLPCTLCSGRGVVDKERPRVSEAATPRRSAETARPLSLADRLSAYITTSPGVGLADVQAIFDLSKSEAERTLRSLVEAHKIKEKDELYYPV